MKTLLLLASLSLVTAHADAGEYVTWHANSAFINALNAAGLKPESVQRYDGPMPLYMQPRCVATLFSPNVGMRTASPNPVSIRCLEKAGITTYRIADLPLVALGRSHLAATVDSAMARWLFSGAEIVYRETGPNGLIHRTSFDEEGGKRFTRYRFKVGIGTGPDLEWAPGAVEDYLVCQQWRKLENGNTEGKILRTECDFLFPLAWAHYGQGPIPSVSPLPTNISNPPRPVPRGPMHGAPH